MNYLSTLLVLLAFLFLTCLYITTGNQKGKVTATKVKIATHFIQTKLSQNGPQIHTVPHLIISKRTKEDLLGVRYLLCIIHDVFDIITLYHIGAFDNGGNS